MTEKSAFRSSGVLLLRDQAISGKRVLIREDLNVPIKDGVVTNDSRIKAALPTIRKCIEQNAAVIVMSHLGRPREGEFDSAFSLAPVAETLSSELGHSVPLVDDWASGVEVSPGEIVLLENVRFATGETANDDGLAKAFAALCDVFVMDAFATAHRAHSSTHGVAKHAAIACAGPLLEKELEALTQALLLPKRPLIAIVGGAKVSNKLKILESLTEIADMVIVGGGIANTFVLAAGKSVGASLVEKNLVEVASRIAGKVDIPLPSDVMTARQPSEDAQAVLRLIDDVAADEMVLDIGPVTARTLKARLEGAGTIIWNGPLGVFEIDQFGEGTRVIAEAVAASDAFSIAGGGDTVAAMDKYGVREKISYVSTGGGAFLEFVEGKQLPAVEILQSRAW